MFTRRARRALSALERPTVVVHLTSDKSIKGVLSGVYDDVLVLRHAALLATDGSVVSLDGEQMIPRERVEFIQRTAGGDAS